MRPYLEEVGNERREEAERKVREEAERLQQERREREAREEAAREQQARWADRFRVARSWLVRILRDPVWQGIAGVIAIIAFIVTFVSMGGPYKVASFLRPTPTPIPTADIKNGDLETGDFTYWAHGGSYPQSVASRLYNGELPYEGHYCIQLGEPVPCISQTTASSAWIYQDFVVPNVPGTVSISFAYRIITNDIYDWASFHAELRAPNGALLTRILRDGYKSPSSPPCGNDLGWKTFSYNLEAYKGQTVHLYLESKNEWDGGLGIWTYVDAIYLTYAR
jgi:hypothetical protein